MKILGDSQILLFEELFSTLGETATYDGRQLKAEQLRDVDVLITRSTVNVDRALLSDSAVKFVGTCTIGIDHFDTDYLDHSHIAWANAPGCNAKAVVQYVLSAMAKLSPQWMQSTVGIIGCGNIGGRVYQHLRALGVECRVYDPFLSVDDNVDLTSLEAVLQSDIVTCHAPLTTAGEYPSHHLVGDYELQQLRPNTLLISAGRGAVVDNQALLRALSSGQSIRVALDVWEGEPDISAELLQAVDIATPHIAGHTLEGKEQGTVMVFQQLCDYLQRAPDIDAQQVVNQQTAPLIVSPSLEVPRTTLETQNAFNQLLLAAYPIMDDDRLLRSWNPSSVLSIGEHFDHLRKHYAIRREYTHFEFPSWVVDTPINQWLEQLKESS